MQIKKNGRLVNMTGRPKRIFNLLLSVAQNHPSPVRGRAHVAAVVKGNKVYTIGVNSYTTDPFQLLNGAGPESMYVHAEVSAIKTALNLRFPETVAGFDLYVLGLSKGGSIINSRPCVGCQRAIDNYQLGDIYYTCRQ